MNYISVFVIISALVLTSAFLYFLLQNEPQAHPPVMVATPVVVPRASPTIASPQINLILFPIKLEGNSAQLSGFKTLFDSQLVQSIENTNCFKAQNIESNSQVLQKVKNYLDFGTHINEVTLVVEGQGLDKQSALDNAMENAIAQACGVQLSSVQGMIQSMSTNGENSSVHLSYNNSVNIHTTGEIKKYTLISEGQTPSGYSVKIKAVVIKTQDKLLKNTARYLLVPVVTGLEAAKSTITIGNTAVNNYRLEIDVQFNIVDSYTDSVILTKNITTYENATGYSQWEWKQTWENGTIIYSKLIKAATDKIAAELLKLKNSMTWSANLIVQNGNMFIDQGSLNGITNGMIFEISRKNYPIIEPDTDQFLGYNLINVGKVSVIAVHSNYSILQLINANTKPMNGDLLIFTNQK